MAAELLSIVAAHSTSAVVVTTAPAIGDVPAEYPAALTAAVPCSALITLLAPGCGPTPSPGVRGIDASMEEALGSTWSISVIGPTMAASILADSLGADVRDPVHHRIVRDRTTVADILRLSLSQLSGRSTDRQLV